jgi:two-component system cell cycle response regulator
MTAGRPPLSNRPASPERGRSRARSRIWVIYPALAFLAVGCYYLLPDAGDARAVRVAIYCAISASGAAAILVGIRRRRPQPRLPWVLLALGQLVYAAADTTFYVSHDLLGHTGFPAPSDALYLAHYPLLVWALFLLIRLRAPGRGLPGLLDAATLAVAASMLSWLYLMAPQVRTDTPALTTLVLVAYPAADLAVFVVGLRLVIERGRRPASFFLICASLLAILAADTLYVWQQAHGVYETGNVLDLLWLSGNIALGTAALHPSMSRLSEPGPLPVTSPGRLRIATLAAASLVAPATLLIQARQSHSGSDMTVIALACAAMFLLTILRMTGLVTVQRQLAITDGLTGLLTRRHLENRLAVELTRARRAHGVLSLFLVDVDHFKLVNDRWGHQAGDRVLVEIANRLRRATADLEGGLLARFGGEEFALLVPHAGPDGLAATAERLRHAVASSPVALGPDSWTSVTVSVGAASYPAHAADVTELVGVVDGALYAAKARGRDRAVIGPAPRSRAAVVDLPHLPPTDPHIGASRMLDYLSYVADDVDGRLSGHEHSSAIARWARAMALELGHDADTVRRVELAGRLHDVGKIVVPDAVLTKPAQLSADEWALMAQHAEHGFRLTHSVPGLMSVAETIRQHHERFDGTGYPAGLTGREIRVEARLIAVCDSWAAMRADRLYQGALSEEQARDELLAGRGTQFDGDVVDLFLDLRDRGVVGDLRRLRAGPAGPGDAGVPDGPARVQVTSARSASRFQNISS